MLVAPSLECVNSVSENVKHASCIPSASHSIFSSNVNTRAVPMAEQFIVPASHKLIFNILKE